MAISIINQQVFWIFFILLVGTYFVGIMIIMFLLAYKYKTNNVPAHIISKAFI